MTAHLREQFKPLFDAWNAELKKLALLDETDTVAAAVARIDARREQRDGILKAIALATEQIEKLSPADSASEFHRGVWPKVVPEVINNAGRGLTVNDIFKAAHGHPALVGMDYTYNAVRQGVNKLADAGRLKRIAKQYFTLELLGAEAPKKKTKKQIPTADHPITHAVLRLDGIQRGLTSLQILNALRDQPDLDLGVKSQYLYNVLVRMKDRGFLEREGDFYSRTIEGHRILLAKGQKTRTAEPDRRAAE